MPLSLDFEAWANIAKVVDVLIKAVALAIGGWWTWRVFVRHRQRFPKLELEHSVETRRLTEEHRLVRLTVKLKNCGDVLVDVASRLAMIYQVVPVTDNVRQRLEVKDTAPDIAKPNKVEGDWLQIGCRQKEPGAVELEPKEQDYVYYDFVVSAEVQTIIAYSYFKNNSKKNIGWSLSTMQDLVPNTPPDPTPPTDAQQPPKTPTVPSNPTKELG